MPTSQTDLINSLLCGVDLNEQSALFDACTRLTLADGAVLVEPGQENHHLYILMHGRMTVFLTSDTSQPGFQIVPGECIGEMSIIDGQPVSARVVSVGESHLVAVPEAHFWEHLAPLPGVARNLLRLMSKRMRDRNQMMIRAAEHELQLAHLHKELAAAGSIQMGMLPRHPHSFRVTLD
jgi:sigma-B regulation protein RsbU (phosphoserine phosphatase)